MLNDVRGIPGSCCKLVFFCSSLFVAETGTCRVVEILFLVEKNIVSLSVSGLNFGIGSMSMSGSQTSPIARQVLIQNAVIMFTLDVVGCMCDQMPQIFVAVVRKALFR